MKQLGDDALYGLGEGSARRKEYREAESDLFDRQVIRNSVKFSASVPMRSVVGAFSVFTLVEPQHAVALTYFRWRRLRSPSPNSAFVPVLAIGLSEWRAAANAISIGIETLEKKVDTTLG